MVFHGLDSPISKGGGNKQHPKCMPQHTTRQARHNKISGLSAGEREKIPRAAVRPSRGAAGRTPCVSAVGHRRTSGRHPADIGQTPTWQPASGTPPPGAQQRSAMGPRRRLRLKFHPLASHPPLLSWGVGGGVKLGKATFGVAGFSLCWWLGGCLGFVDNGLRRGGSRLLFTNLALFS